MGGSINRACQGALLLTGDLENQACLIIAHDDDLGADVICAELNPAEVTVDELARLILLIAWPRSLRSSAPGDRIWLDYGVADKAGRARNDQTGRSAFKAMRSAPPIGLGMPSKI